MNYKGFIVIGLFLLALFLFIYYRKSKKIMYYPKFTAEQSKDSEPTSAGEYIDKVYSKCNFCCTGGLTEDQHEIKNLEKDPKYCDDYMEYHITNCGIHTEECDRDITCLRDCFKTRRNDDTISKDDIDICRNRICG